MSIPRVDSGFCGCSLKTSTKIIGWFSLIKYIVYLTVPSIALGGLYYFENHPKDTSEQFKEALPVLKFLAVFYIVIYSVDTVLSFLLLMGVYQEKAKLVLIWVFATTASLLMSLLGQIVYAIKEPLYLKPWDVVSLLLKVYFLLVVYSFYRANRRTC